VRVVAFRLRYVPGTNDGTRFQHITYPLSHNPGYPTRERAQTVLDAMPDPSRMEIFEEDI
jgi:hypothetical protein